MILVLFISFLLYAFFEGKREAYYYHSAVKTGDSTAYNIHWMYFIQRGLFAISVVFLDENILLNLTLLLSMAFCFSFIHNGSYFLQRNNLNKNIYPKRWKDTSFTSTSFFEFTYKERLIQFILGVIMLFFLLYLKYFL